MKLRITRKLVVEVEIDHMDHAAALALDPAEQLGRKDAEVVFDDYGSEVLQDDLQPCVCAFCYATWSKNEEKEAL